MRLFWIIANIVFILDKITKFFVIKITYPYKEVLIQICPVLNIVKYWNKGIAFGLFSKSGNLVSWLLIGSTFIILLGSFLWAKNIAKEKKDNLSLVALGMLFGGGLGNLVDRIVYGAVLDFIDLHIKHYHWPAFNVADIAITFSLILLLYKYLK
ncbi:signal peptidase II [Thermodesulfobacterium hydrogeniphilum]|uniref:signal peptidase II n=1 Tax=Thermodesulfobacterium hydrogeniphilum TaxID=161156 RepID=UPI00056F2878|nr:signal peptidase II [Thermodesulfobacterium hydrogeniphilum]